MARLRRAWSDPTCMLRVNCFPSVRMAHHRRVTPARPTAIFRQYRPDERAEHERRSAEVVKCEGIRHAASDSSTPLSPTLKVASRVAGPCCCARWQGPARRKKHARRAYAPPSLYGRCSR
jgi:hypothetical protein